MRGLGEIATDSTVTYTNNTDRIANGLTGAGLDSTQVAAGKSIFNILLRAATEGYRRDQLDKLILDYDKDVQSLITGLKIIISDNYLSKSLRAEKDALDVYFEGYIEERAIDAKKPNTILSAEVLSIDTQWKSEQDALRARKEKAQLYVAILDKISTGHKRLYDLFFDSKTNTKTASCRINKCDQISPLTVMEAKNILAETLEEIEPITNRI